MYELRPYQAEAKQAVLSEWDSGHRKTLLSLPTGCGKTIVFSSIAETETQNGERSLILAHRDELLRQAADKLLKATGIESSLEKAESTSFGDPRPVTIGSVQSLSRESRLNRFPKDYFQTIIVDEAHHCLSDTYQTVLRHFGSAKVLGVTATPDRGDMRNLGEYFDSMAYEYSMVDAVKEGYLCPIKAQMIPLKMDLSEVKTNMGDFTDSSLGSALEPYLEEIADQMKVYCKGRKTLVFLPLISTSLKFCEILRSRGMKAAEVDGKSKDREEILADFEAGKYDVLCNAMLLTEGWDCPSLDCIVVLRPTKIRSLYVQMVGRGTRICEGKENLLLLDFLWLTTKHNLCRPSAIFGKNDDQTARIDNEVQGAAEPVDLVQAAENAEKSSAEENREKSLVNGIRANRNKKKATLDPLHVATYIIPELQNYAPVFKWEEEDPTDKQLEALRNYGFDVSGIDSKGEASFMIDGLKKRSAENLATPKQVNVLLKFGFDHAADYTFEQARRLIGRIAENRWKVPRDMYTAMHDERKGVCHDRQ